MKKVISLSLCLVILMSVLTLPASAVEQTAGEVTTKFSFSDLFYMIFNKEELVNSSFTGTPSGESWSTNDEYNLEDTIVLTKEKGEDFVILNFTDIHLSDYSKKVIEGIASGSIIKKLVARVKPDLITVTGDIMCGDSTAYSAKYFTALMDSFGIPWAPVFGNHDNEANCDLNFISDVFLTSENCLLKKGPEELGVGNYIINIAENNGGQLDVVQSLIMMYTHSNCLLDNQIDWYEWAATGISEEMGHDVESTVFCHIPCAQYQYAFDEAWDSENECWRDSYIASGARYETIGCHRDIESNPIDNGFFARMLSVGTTKNIFCGHDHLNNFNIEYQGINLNYTLKCGMGSGYHFGFNGGTKITINDDGVSFEHKYCFYI